MATDRTKWTPEMLDRFHELRARNYTVLEIAEDMGLRFEVVQGKINREKMAEKADEKNVFRLGPPSEPESTPPFSGNELTQEEPLLTKQEAGALANFVDFWIFDAIRKDPDADNVKWLLNLVHAYDKLCVYSGYQTGGLYHDVEAGSDG